MKTLFAISISLLFFTSCKKYVNACKELTELKDRAHSTDIAGENAQELKDTLQKHNELQLISFQAGENYWTARCNVFYKDLLIFSDFYTLSKNFSTGLLYTYDTLRTPNISFSLEPAMSYKDAIKVAKKRLNFDHTCVYYRLGLYNLNVTSGYNKPKNYKLVWKVEGTNGYPYVIVDANSKEVIVADEGIRYGWID